MFIKLNYANRSLGVAVVLFSRELISTIAKLSMDVEEASNDERKRLPTFKLTVRFCFKGTLKALVN